MTLMTEKELKLSPATLKVVNEIKSSTGEIYPMFYGVSNPRANVSAAFRFAKQNGIIEEIGVDGTGQGKVYQLAGIWKEFAQSGGVQ